MAHGFFNTQVKVSLNYGKPQEVEVAKKVVGEKCRIDQILCCKHQIADRWVGTMKDDKTGFAQ